MPIEMPINNPQETRPVKKPMPEAITAKAAKALPPLPVTMLETLHISVKKASPTAKESRMVKGKITSSAVRNDGIFFILVSELHIEPFNGSAARVAKCAI